METELDNVFCLNKAINVAISTNSISLSIQMYKAFKNSSSFKRGNYRVTLIQIWEVMLVDYLSHALLKDTFNNHATTFLTSHSE